MTHLFGSAGLVLALAAADPPPVFRPDGRLRADDYTVLMAVDAERSPDLRPFQPGGHGKFYVEGWQRSEQFARWTVSVPAADEYAAQVLLRRRRGAELRVTVSSGDQQVRAALAAVERGWQRLALPGTLRLPAGPVRIALDLGVAATAGAADAFDADVLSVELVRPAVSERLHAAALALRADTRELQRARYGFMVHWTSDSFPRHGPRQPYAQAVRDFRVEAFADQMQAGGAGFVVLTTSHAYQYVPAPCAALDRLLPGRTAQRDLIGELADALGRRGLQLWLYYHLGASCDTAWMQASGFFDTDASRLFDGWCAIVGELGERYGEKLAGWWFDDGSVNYYYRSAPWERLATVARRGNPRRLIGFNPWELPPPTLFMDYFCGEGFGDPGLGGALPVGGDGRITRGPYQGLQACATLITEGDWGHFRPNAEIGRQQRTAPQMAAWLREFGARRNVPIFNLEIYQDGTCSPATIEMFRQAREQLTAPPVP